MKRFFEVVMNEIIDEIGRIVYVIYQPSNPINKVIGKNTRFSRYGCIDSFLSNK